MSTLPSHTYYFSGIKNGPTVVIIGAMHGNEKIGVRIIEALKKLLPKEEISGEIYLIIGNPKAYKKNVRFVDCDLNRLFNYKINHLSKKDLKELTIEEKRATEIAPILSKADYLLDIHSTIKKAVPFVYVKNSPAHFSLAKLFGTKYIVSSSQTFKTKNLHSCADNFVDRHGGIGITYESGWHKDDSMFTNVLIKTKKFLQNIGSSSLSIDLNYKEKKSKHIFIYQDIVPQTNNFTFSKDCKNFDLFKKGESFATDGDKPVIAKQDSYIVFPKTDIHIWKTACYLASELSFPGTCCE